MERSTLYIFALLLSLGLLSRGQAQQSANEGRRERERERERERPAGRERETEGPYSFTGHHRHGDHNARGESPDYHAGEGADHAGRGGGGGGRGSRCRPGHFLSRTTGLCQSCSKCPVNEIIRRPCDLHRDTVCGPFYEFRPGQSNSQPDNEQLYREYLQHEQRRKANRGTGAHGAGGNNNNGGDGNENDAFDDEVDEDDDDEAVRNPPKSALEEQARASSVEGNYGNGYQGDDAGGAPALDSTDAQEMSNGQTKGPTVQSSADQWRELCYGLIGALAVVTFLALLYIIITQIQARRRSSKYSDPAMSPTMRVFANGFLSTTDYQRIAPPVEEQATRRPRNWFLRHLRQAHKTSSPNPYVLESDVIIPLHVIPESVEVERHQRGTSPSTSGEGQGEGGGQSQAAQVHEGQGDRLDATQSWDSGISTQDGPKL